MSALLAFFVPFTWAMLGLCVASHFLRAIGLTLSFHRYFAHRAFQMNRGARFVWAFIGTAAMDGFAEVEHGRLAARNASSPEVKQFAQRMVDDHSKAAGELRALASQKDVILAAKLDREHRSMHDKLAKLRGAPFDTGYMEQMVTAHEQGGVAQTLTLKPSSKNTTSAPSRFGGASARSRAASFENTIIFYAIKH